MMLLSLSLLLSLLLLFVVAVIAGATTSEDLICRQ
jgi:hypothetical protein